MRYVLLFFLIGHSLVSRSQPEDPMRMAEVLSAAGRYAESNSLLEAFIARNPGRLYEKGEALFLESYNFLQLNELGAALEANTASLKLRQQFVPEGLATNYLRYGEIYLRQGQFERALSVLFRAEEFPLMDDPQSAALIRQTMGQVFFSLQQYERARRYFQHSLDVLAIELGEESAGVAENHFLIGQAFFRERDYEEASRAFGQALAIEGGLAGGAPRKARLLNALGKLLEARGEAKAAQPFYRQALEVCRAEHPIQAAESLLNLASWHLGQGGPQAAEENVQLAVAMLCPGFSADEAAADPPSGQAVLSRPLLAKALEIKAAAALEEGNPPALERALASSRRGMDALEAETAAPAGAANRLFILQEGMGVYETGLEAAFALYRLSGDTAYAARAFEISERARASVFQLNRNGRQAGLPFRDASHVYAGADVASLREVQQKLEEETALLSYYFGQANAYIFALTRENFEFHRLEGVDELKAEARDYLDALEKRDAARFFKTSSSLHTRLAWPLAGLLKKKGELVVAPSPGLDPFPFEALISGPVSRPDKAKHHKLGYLGKNHAIRYCPSATMFSRQGAPSAAAGQGWLGLAPAFGPEMENSRVHAPNAYAFDTAYQYSRSLLATAPDGEHFAVLPASGKEAETIAALFSGKGIKAVALTGLQATEKAAKGQGVSCRYLHLATHGFASGANPALSGLAFSQAEGQEEEDGVLFAEEIARLPIQAELVVISHFHSDAGGPAPGEGWLALALPFLEAGAANLLIIARSNDVPEEIWMARFYESLLSGQAPAAALHQARLQMMRGQETAAPWFWARAMLVGR